MNLQDIKLQIENSSNILITLPTLTDADSVAVSSLLYKHIISKGKNVSIASSKKIPSKYLDILNKAEFDTSKVLDEIKPISYVISVQEINDKVDVNWDKSENQINLRLTPESGIVDFEKIKYSREGGIYDLIITINTKKLKNLGKVYSNHSRLFEDFNIISIGAELSLEGKDILSLIDENYTTTSEIIFQHAKDLGIEIDSVSAEITAHGIVGSTKGLQRIDKKSTFGVIAELANKYQIDFASIVRKYFYSMDLNEARLQERILKNLRFDDSRKTVYSVLTNTDLSDIGISVNSSDLWKLLPLHVNGKYDYSFIACEDGLNTNIFFSATKPETDFTKIVERANGIENKNLAHININSNANDASIRMLSIISGGEFHETKTVEPAIANSPVVQVTAYTEVPVQQIPQEFVYTPVQNSNTFQSQLPNQNINISQNNPVMQSPFTKATNTDYIDNTAKPLKQGNFFTLQNKPFDPIVNQ